LSWPTHGAHYTPKHRADQQKLVIIGLNVNEPKIRCQNPTS
jgi:hypothetical protein